MKIELKDLKVGDKVWCGGDSGFTTDSIEKVENISFKYDENTGKKYKVIHLSSNNQTFDSRTGDPISAPLAYYIKPTENDIDVKIKKEEAEDSCGEQYIQDMLDSY